MVHYMRAYLGTVVRAIRLAGLGHGGETLMTESRYVGGPINDESHPVLAPPIHASPVTPNRPSRQGFRTFLVVFDLSV